MDKLPDDFKLKKTVPTICDELKDIKISLEKQTTLQELIITQLDTMLKILELQARTINTGIYSISILLSLFFVLSVLWG